MNKKTLRRELDSYQKTQRAEDYKNYSFTIVLVRPEHAGNIGSIARIMTNFDFEHLVVFNPIESVENIFRYETQGFAMHGKDILLGAEIIEISKQENSTTELKKFLTPFDLVLATTSRGKRYSNLKRLAIFPEDLRLPLSQKPLKVAILFGRESRGLDNEEIGLVDIMLRIPTGSSYPTLNISHACGIILYEIFKKVNLLNIGRGKNPVVLASRDDRQLLLKMVEKIINNLKIRMHKKENVYYAFRNVFERALISGKELSLITGVYSKVNRILESLDLYEE
ncbi:MAG: RNA methyltransferase [Promethearchaeota archaeon]